MSDEGLGIEPQKWKDVGAFGVMKYRVTSTGGNAEITFRLYEVEKGKTPVLTKSYRGSERDIRSMTHRNGSHDATAEKVHAENATVPGGRERHEEVERGEGQRDAVDNDADGAGALHSKGVFGVAVSVLQG